MIDGVRAHPELHPLCDESLGFVDDHVVGFGQQEPCRPTTVHEPGIVGAPGFSVSLVVLAGS